MEKRQFIWIMTDTTGSNMVSCYGSKVQTPCIDSMAEQGMRIDRAYTCQPVCGPARSALFTGQFPHSNASWGNSMPIGKNVQTIGERLTNQGIHCGYIGKWHLDAGDYFGDGICPEGWDSNYWYDMKCYLDELSDEEKVFSRKEEASDQNINADFTYGHRVTQRALDFLEKYKDEDFFLVVSYDEPHGPSLCPEPYASMYGTGEMDLSTKAWMDDLQNKPMFQRLWAEDAKGLDVQGRMKGISTRLAACNSYIDSEIGRILSYARKSVPDSLRMFTSDHGDAAHAHGIGLKGPCVYDEVARVPLLFEGNTVQKAVYPHVVSHIDLPATVLHYMGLEKPLIFEGESLLPILSDPTQETNRPAFVEFSRYEIDHDGFGGFQPMRAIITDEYKMAVHLLDTDELYNILQDSCDMNNLINNEDYADIRVKLHDALLAWMNDTRDPFRGYQWQCRPWRKDKKPSWKVDGYTRQRKTQPPEKLQLDYETGLSITEFVRRK